MTVSVNFARKPFRDNRLILLMIGLARVLGVLPQGLIGADDGSAASALTEVLGDEAYECTRRT
jgi:hypothetical protein